MPALQSTELRATNENATRRIAMLLNNEGFLANFLDPKKSSMRRHASKT